jgi:hypothetical protein
MQPLALHFCCRILSLKKPELDAQRQGLKPNVYSFAGHVHFTSEILLAKPILIEETHLHFEQFTLTTDDFYPKQFSAAERLINDAVAILK